MKIVVQICRFHALQLYRRQPLVAVLTGLSVLAVLVSALAWALLFDARQEAARDLVAIASRPKTDPATSVASNAARNLAPDLPAFSSAALTADFHAISADVKLPVDEVIYTLDGSANQPYLRYRVTLSVKTGYPQIRKFVAALVAALPNVALDSVRCAKEDATSATLSCQLAFSAFYRKDGRG